MLDFFWHPHFVLVQGIILSISISLVVANKDMTTIYNRSLFYKMTTVFLLICSLIISFVELKWWVAMLYLIATFLIESTLGNILITVIIPNEYFYPTQLKLHPSFLDKISSIFILSNYAIMLILLVISIYTILF